VRAERETERGREQELERHPRHTHTPEANFEESSGGNYTQDIFFQTVHRKINSL